MILALFFSVNTIVKHVNNSLGTSNKWQEWQTNESVNIITGRSLRVIYENGSGLDDWIY
jgi:hypothetical protein